jgi:hypothetical protein
VSNHAITFHFSETQATVPGTTLDGLAEIGLLALTFPIAGWRCGSGAGDSAFGNVVCVQWWVLVLW